MKKFLFFVALVAALLVSCNKQVSIGLNETTVRLTVGDSKTLTATVEGSTKKALTWKSSDVNVASVANGVVTAVSEGSAEITVSTRDASARCRVEVFPGPESITLDPAILTLQVGESSRVTATVRPHRTLDKTVTWKSLKPDIASVEDGWVSGLAEGNATITATAGSVTTNLSVTVLPQIQALTVPYMEDFEDTTTFDNWTVIDKDEDGYGWYHGMKHDFSNKPKTFTTHSDSCCVASASSINDIGALTPDNWLFSPAIRLDPSSNYLCCWLCYQDVSWKQEHYGIYISEYSESGPSTDGCTLLTEGTISQGSLTSSLVRTETVKGEGSLAYEWEMHVIRIPDSFNGKYVYISFRHFNCNDMFWIVLDDVSITASDPRTSPAPAAASASRKARPSGTQTSQTSYKIVR